ncbi:BrnA antitoxin family protein [Bdellovibrio bacteriovorus]|uniref:BrnA antitoxin family protein n=1 Tax=Bdellovibrio bacteriovorus TaxID=959 RepID=UPI0009BD13CA|nr:BrnA antitoxin family protein [Bdellovibrio bacteriovorus]
MRKEYDLKKMKAVDNPYIDKLKQTITIRLDSDVIEYFKDLSKRTHVPYQTLVNDFLRNCKDQKLAPKTIWRSTAETGNKSRSKKAI